MGNGAVCGVGPGLLMIKAWILTGFSLVVSSCLCLKTLGFDDHAQQMLKRSSHNPKT